ncbi:MAG: hypothetical protein ACI3X4_07550, partial [Bacteroidaceae bacterium]
KIFLQLEKKISPTGQFFVFCCAIPLHTDEIHKKSLQNIKVKHKSAIRVPLDKQGKHISA